MKKQNEIVAAFVNYQRTGVGFDDVWAGIGPIVEEFARQWLQKLGVRGPGGYDEFAVGEVVSLMVEKLMGLAAPNAGGRFDPAKAQPGLSGLKGWLRRVVQSQAVNWVRDRQGGRGVKIIPESGLAWNDCPAGDEGESFMSRVPAKFERDNLQDVVYECLRQCVSRLPDPVMKEIVQLKLDRNLSLRDSAEVVKLSPATVQRRLQKAYEFLREMLAEQGIDGAALAA